MPHSLKDRTVLVVGASSGMGRETATLFAREGARVMASARREDRLRDWEGQMLREQLDVAVHVADASDPTAMEQLAQATQSRFGGLDILIFATGTNTPDRALPRLTPAIWEHMLSVNLNAAYYASRAVLPAMRERRSGSIFYISSKSAVIPDESGAAYQAAKRGLSGLAHAIRFEERGNGIKTCVVFPGLADTEILEKRLVKPSAETLSKALRAEDVAETILAIAKLPPRAWVPEVQLFPADL